MTDNSSEKDKKDWENFLLKKEKLPDKDFKIDKKKTFKTRSIDLHGYKIDEACRSLSDFIHFHSDKRFIQIIHGKGYHSNNCMSIMKSQVIHYLKQHPNVLAFCSCPQDMGGTGAVFVHLRAYV